MRFRFALFRPVGPVLAALSISAGVLGCDSKRQPAEPIPTALSSAPSAQPGAHTSASSQPSATASPSTGDSGPKEPLNVLLLTVDSLRTEVPWTGYERKIAPNLTELAEKSTVYPRAYSIASNTAKSVAAMLTSRYPSSLYRSGTFFTAYSDANLFFPELLQKHGARTLGGHGHMYFGRGKNLDQGFDLWQVVEGLRFDSDTDKNVTSAKLTDLAIKMLSELKNPEGQFFLWFHYMDPHDQYIQHEGTPVWGKSNRDRYDSEVFYTDREIGRLFEYGRKQPWWDKTAIIVSADHGETFGEHGMHKHAFALWEPLVRVPLIVYAPGAKGQVIEQRRSHIDIGPTVLELMGVKEKPETFYGHSLVDEIYGKSAAKNREPILLDLPEDTNNPDRHALILGDYKLTVFGRPAQTFALHNLEIDPGEETDLSKKQPEKLEELKALYEKTWAGLEVIEPYGGNKLRSGKTARGPMKP